VLPDWYRVQAFDFTGSGFDRGHMVPNADRDKETSIPINQATFLMTNMLAQAPDNNQGPWAAFEGYLRTLLPSDEIYIVAGGAGSGGTGSNGGLTVTLANGHVAVPASTWKVALVIPKGFSDVSRVSCSSRTIAVIMPNVQGIRNNPWENYLTTVDAVEALTGYNLFSELPLAIQQCVEAGVNGNNPPLDDAPPVITITAPSALTYIVGQAVIANYTCVDAASVVTTCSGSVASGQPISTSTPGGGVFTVTASDTAGNTTSQSVSYSVGYNICALYDQSKAHKSGSTVPIKLQVCNYSAANASSPAITVAATSIVRLADNAPGVLEDSGNANPDNQFRFVPEGGGSYIFNLSTKSLAQGTYALTFIVAGDPTTHVVQFQVR